MKNTKTEMVNGLRASHSHILSRDNDEDDKRNNLKLNFLFFTHFYFMNLFLMFTFISMSLIAPKTSTFNF